MSGIQPRTEAELLAEVTDRCARRGLWWVHIDTPYHNRRRQNMIGFPDLFVCGPGGAAFRELKRETGKMSAEQKVWGHLLRAAGQDWDLWRPSHLQSGLIDRELDRLCRMPGDPERARTAEMLRASGWLITEPLS
jgi:hypothetical protein